MSVVLRYGATQKQRLGYSRSGRGPGRPSIDSVDSAAEVTQSGDLQEVDRVAAMVEGVKTRGVSNDLCYNVGKRRLNSVISRERTC